ncbi:hypothetical protein KM043_012020 [Ampulex compressa]|nr:hypothetical protein KM043_012020 [Ampulex compressa]
MAEVRACDNQRRRQGMVRHAQSFLHRRTFKKNGRRDQSRIASKQCCKLIAIAETRDISPIASLRGSKFFELSFFNLELSKTQDRLSLDAIPPIFALAQFSGDDSKRASLWRGEGSDRESDRRGTARDLRSVESRNPWMSENSSRSECYG